MSATTSETNGELPIQIYANPGWLWIVWTSVMAMNLPFLVSTGLRHPVGIAIFTITICTLVGTTVWMVHVPHISVTATGLTIRHWIGHTDVPFEDITAWGTSLGAFYVRQTDGRKINATMFLYVDRADRERLFTALAQQGLNRE